MVNRIYLHLVLHDISGLCSGEREEKSGFIIGLLTLWQNPSSNGLQVPLCDEGQVSSEKRDVPDAEEGNENTDGRTSI